MTRIPGKGVEFHASWCRYPYNGIFCACGKVRPQGSLDEDESVYQVIAFLDEKMSAKAFIAVDEFLEKVDVDATNSATYLLAICGYVYTAKERGDLLVKGPAFRERAERRMRELVGPERTERLLKNR